MSQKKNEGILFSAEIRVVGSYADRFLLKVAVHSRSFHLTTKIHVNCFDQLDFHVCLLYVKVLGAFGSGRYGVNIA